MNYNVDELFSFRKIEDGYALAEYLKIEDVNTTELELPEEYNGLPVVLIEGNAFSQAQRLKSVALPKRLTAIGDCAFWHCDRLESIIFNSAPRLGRDVFFGCRLLPADVTLMGLVGSRELSTPFDKEDFAEAFTPPSSSFMKRLFEDYYAREAILSPEVFELAVKNNCFRNVDVSVMTNFLIEYWDARVVRLAWEQGFLDGAELIDKHIEYSVRRGETELTAFLLELKKRKFGFEDFEGGSGLEL